ncbi:hypothetical protein PGTUg99_007875 [Puccinia graminis f. sp. tritici]|uniref:Uncharacterized protein n=1 Tax=Puccinia graminis f. sp. tritici TaxID=56615 RepID=A0A5B0LHI5_PUCGR|nr:hypothetical protein PGTUg99_007875 [Puccinia graminis f. sp. tritici]
MNGRDARFGMVFKRSIRFLSRARPAQTLGRPPSERLTDTSRCKIRRGLADGEVPPGTTGLRQASASPTMDSSESNSWPPLLPRLLSAMVFQNPPSVGFESQHTRSDTGFRRDQGQPKRHFLLDWIADYKSLLSDYHLSL